MPLSKGAFHEKQLRESHHLFRGAVEFLSVLFIFIVYLGEIPCKKSDHNTGCSCFLRANWRRVGQTLLLGTSELKLMHVPSSL